MKNLPLVMDLGGKLTELIFLFGTLISPSLGQSSFINLEGSQTHHLIVINWTTHWSRQSMVLVIRGKNVFKIFVPLVDDFVSLT